jgi:hypothetical protein
MNAKARKRAEPPHWLVRPSTIRLMWRYGLAMLAAVTLADLALTPHPYFDIDGSFGFYSWYGLVTCAAMVFFAKGLGYLLKRDDDYYGDDRE